MVTNQELFEIGKTLKIRDVIRVFVKMKAYEKFESMLITNVGMTEKGGIAITYVPCKQPDSVQCGFGCHFLGPEPTGANSAGRWGWQSIEVIGQEKPIKYSQGIQLYKNPGYDLVNI